MKKLNDDEINKFLNDWFLDSVKHKTGASKQELIKLISKITGKDEKELGKNKKEDLVEKYIAKKGISTEELSRVNAEFPVFLIRKAMEIDDSKTMELMIQKSKVDTGFYEGRAGVTYETVSFKNALKLIKYINKNFDGTEKTATIYISSKTKEGVELAVEELFGIKGFVPNLSFDRRYGTFGVQTTILLNKKI